MFNGNLCVCVLRLLKYIIKIPGVVVYASNLSAQVAEAGLLLQDCWDRVGYGAPVSNPLLQWKKDSVS